MRARDKTTPLGRRCERSDAGTGLTDTLHAELQGLRAVARRSAWRCASVDENAASTGGAATSTDLTTDSTAGTIARIGTPLARRQTLLDGHEYVARSVAAAMHSGNARPVDEREHGEGRVAGAWIERKGAHRVACGPACRGVGIRTSVARTFRPSVARIAALVTGTTDQNDQGHHRSNANVHERMLCPAP